MSEGRPAGYAMGDPAVPGAPISITEFDRLKQTVTWTDEDDDYLRMAGDIIEPQVEAFVDELFGFAASHEFLLYYFTDGSGNPDPEYVERVRGRVVQWVRDTCETPYGQDWLNYQFEIGRRKHRTKKNRTDGVDAVPHLNFRYFSAFLYPITAFVRPFLQNGDRSPDEVDRMYHAWFKSMVLQVALRSHPYVTEGDW